MGARRLALHDRHLELGARMVDFAGYRMPLSYSTIIDEHRAVRGRGGFFDVSHMGEVFVRGPEAETFLNRMTVNNVARLQESQVQYSAMMTPEGGIVDDLLVHRFDRERFLLVVNAANRKKDLDWLTAHLDSDLEIADRSEDYTLLAFQGPEAYRLVLDRADADLSELPYYWFSESKLRGVPAIIARTGYTGERGFEIYVRNELADELWMALVPEALERGLKPAGLGARDSLRLEMKFALYGNDIDEGTSTIEADLGRITKSRKKCDFQGKEVVLRQKSEGVRRRLVGFVMLGRGIPRKEQTCHAGDEEIGVVTSGGHSPMLGRAIGMAYLRSDLAQPDSEFEVDLRGRRQPARVVPTPFYQPEVPCK